MRNKIIYLALGCFVLSRLCFLAEAQQPEKVPRIGYLSRHLPTQQSLGRIEAFRQGLRELGYMEGKNIVVEWRSSEGKLDRFPGLAAELVRSRSISSSRWSDSNPRRQGSNIYDSHCHGVR